MNRRRLIRALPIAVASLAMTAGPAAAHHDQGSHTQQVTEDDDADGVPDDQPDDGDDRHPSGRDRSVDADNGNAQSDPDDDGRGPDRSNGGADKPGGEGGVDQHDQDRNNGCGNDDDFEDDNEGLCLGPDGERPRSDRAQQDRSPEGTTGAEDGTRADRGSRAAVTGAGVADDRTGTDDDGAPEGGASTDDGEVLGVVLERDTDTSARADGDDGAVLAVRDGTADAAGADRDGEVLGITLERDTADVAAGGDSLPLTGAPLGALGAAAVAALAAGTAAVRRREDA